MTLQRNKDKDLMINRQLDEERIFLVARDIASQTSREEYLDQICAGDQALRERVEALLEAHEREKSLLRSNDAIAPTENLTPITETAGTQIGRYKLLQKIGEGGFGVVYMAEQTRPVRRKVALKIIKPGMDTHAVVARFEAERQALALMDHPNIARVLDGGATDSRRPYFVMELVKGVPITEYCDKNQLNTRERLELFITVCQGVQHAHQKGIIHRDLKPSNILVTLHDGKPVVKVIDFGVAKATNQQLTEKTLFTAYGQMVGTPQYMSPEQAEMSGLDVDTRSDVYSLGVLLYELLTGTTPLESERLRTAGYAEMQRLIREEEPPKPSTRLSTSGEKLTVIAKHRSVSPEALRKVVRGDLDWIVMKALDKDRNRRFDTAVGLSSDINRYLNFETIEARPPSHFYRLQKWIRRNKGMAFATAVSITSLLLIAVLGYLFAASERRGREATSEALDHAVRQERKAITETNRAENAINELRQHSYSSTIRDAFYALAVGDIQRSNGLLQRAAELKDASGTEWRFLRDRLREHEPTSSFAFSNSIRNFILSTDGRQIIAILSDHSLVSLDIDTGHETLLSSQMNNGSARGLQMTQDGRYLICCWHSGEQTTIRTWNWPKRTLDKDIEMPGFFSFGPVGSRLAVVFQGAEGFGVWHLDSFKELWRGSLSIGTDLAISSDDKILVQQDWTKQRRVFDAQTGKLKAEVAITENSDQLLLSSDRSLLVSGSPNNTEIATFVDDQPDSLVTINSPGYCLSAPPQSNRIVLSTREAIEVWRLEGRKATLERKVIPPGYSDRNRYFVLGQGRFLFTRTGDDELSCWDLDQPRRIRSTNSHWLICSDYSTDGLYATAEGDDSIVVYDLASGLKQRRFEGHEAPVTGLHFTPNGKSLLSASDDGSLLMWSLDSDNSKKTLIEAQDALLDVSASNNGRFFAACGREGYGQTALGRGWLIEANSEKRFDLGQLAGWAWSVEFSPDSNLLAIGTVGKIYLWQLGDGVPSLLGTATVVGDDNVLDIAFSGDGAFVVTSSVGGVLQSFSVPDLEPIANWSCASYRVQSICIDNSNLTAIGANPAGLVYFWNLRTGEELAVYDANESIASIHATSNGRLSVSQSVNGWITYFPDFD